MVGRHFAPSNILPLLGEEGQNVHQATVTWFLGPRVCLEPFLKSRGDGKIKKKFSSGQFIFWVRFEDVVSVGRNKKNFIIWSGLIDCYRRKNGPKDQVTVASLFSILLNANRHWSALRKIEQISDQWQDFDCHLGIDRGSPEICELDPLYTRAYMISKTFVYFGQLLQSCKFLLFRSNFQSFGESEKLEI